MEMEMFSPFRSPEDQTHSSVLKFSFYLPL